MNDVPETTDEIHVAPSSVYDGLRTRLMRLEEDDVKMTGIVMSRKTLNFILDELQTMGRFDISRLSDNGYAFRDVRVLLSKHVPSGQYYIVTDDVQDALSSDENG